MKEKTISFFLGSLLTIISIYTYWHFTNSNTSANSFKWDRMQENWPSFRWWDRWTRTWTWARNGTGSLSWSWSFSE
jgi:hypothetical protein